MGYAMTRSCGWLVGVVVMLSTLMTDTGAAQLIGHARLQAEIEAFTRALERRFG